MREVYVTIWRSFTSLEKQRFQCHFNGTAEAISPQVPTRHTLTRLLHHAFPTVTNHRPQQKKDASKRLIFCFFLRLLCKRFPDLQATNKNFFKYLHSAQPKLQNDGTDFRFMPSVLRTVRTKFRFLAFFTLSTTFV